MRIIHSYGTLGASLAYCGATTDLARPPITDAEVQAVNAESARQLRAGTARRCDLCTAIAAASLTPPTVWHVRSRLFSKPGDPSRMVPVHSLACYDCAEPVNHRDRETFTVMPSDEGDIHHLLHLSCYVDNGWWDEGFSLDNMWADDSDFVVTKLPEDHR